MEDDSVTSDLTLTLSHNFFTSASLKGLHPINWLTHPSTSSLKDISEPVVCAVLLPYCGLSGSPDSRVGLFLPLCDVWKREEPKDASKLRAETKERNPLKGAPGPTSRPRKSRNSPTTRHIAFIGIRGSCFVASARYENPLGRYFASSRTSSSSSTSRHTTSSSSSATTHSIRISIHSLQHSL